MYAFELDLSAYLILLGSLGFILFLGHRIISEKHSEEHDLEKEGGQTIYYILIFFSFLVLASSVKSQIEVRANGFTEEVIQIVELKEDFIQKEGHNKVKGYFYVESKDGLHYEIDSGIYQYLKKENLSEIKVKVSNTRPFQLDELGDTKVQSRPVYKVYIDR